MNRAKLSPEKPPPVRALVTKASLKSERFVSTARDDAAKCVAAREFASKDVKPISVQVRRAARCSSSSPAEGGREGGREWGGGRAGGGAERARARARVRVRVRVQVLRVRVRVYAQVRRALEGVSLRAAAAAPADSAGAAVDTARVGGVRRAT